MVRSVFPLLLALSACPPASAQPLRTVAESSDYKATSRHADVLEFCAALAKQSPLVRLGELGTSFEGRKLPLLVLSDPPVATAAEAKKAGKLVVLATGNIHAGEVDGKEALLALARDLALAPDHPLLKRLVLVFVPIFNADGNERFGNHRPEQAGPAEVGTRANAQEFDLNRDFVKLESPEARALVRCLNEWDPHVFVDLHTTNGSYHRYALTYEGGRCPAGDPAVVDFTKDKMLPEIGKTLKTRTGYESFFYGTMTPDGARWETVTPTPRFAFHYVGLRNRIAVLSESYTYAPFRDRVLVGSAFVRLIGEYAAENEKAIRELLDGARTRAVAGRGEVPIRFDDVPTGRPVKILGFVEETKDGRRVPTARPLEREALYMGGTKTTKSVTPPVAYLIPADQKSALETLARHGIAVETLKEGLEVEVETARIDALDHAPPFQKHKAAKVETTVRREKVRIPAGTAVVRTAQPLGPLAAFLLEPTSMDGLTTWNFFDASLKVGGDHPVRRVVGGFR